MQTAIKKTAINVQLDTSAYGAVWKGIYHLLGYVEKRGGSWVFMPRSVELSAGDLAGVALAMLELENGE